MALVAVIVFAVLGIVGVSTVLLVTRTNTGREWVRTVAQAFTTRKWKGASVYIGQLSGNFITGLTIDTLAIRDKRGELFLSTGRVTVGFDPRDFIDQRVLIRRAQIEHPYVHLVQHENGVWNFKEIFASSSNELPKPKVPNRRGFGDYIVIDSARTRDATFLLTLPWHPDESLRGAARDSSIRVHLERPEKAVSRTFDGFGRLYAWRNLHGLLTHGRLADPDSDRAFGKEFRVDSLSADEYEPTFKFRNIAGNARILGDSVWFEVPRFHLPASTGNGRGKVWWGSGLPVRYDIAVHGDSVALDDVNWVYATLPRTGGGSLDLTIKNDPKNLDIIEYKLSKMDVHSTKSHLTGDMSFGTGDPILLVRNVNLRADPVDFDLLRTLAGGPFPQDWQGQITGTVKAKGGKLTNFVVDDAKAVFRDAHVPGAVSRFSGNGELDILEPKFTAFHGFHVDVASLDLRTIEYLNPAFPRLGGFISGTATLDSSWLDVRFSDADILHTDGPGEPSHITGSGRVTYDTLMVYDVALDAQPLSLTTLARSYPNPLRGLMSGPIRVKGTAPDLEVETSLQNESAAFSFQGRVDADSINGYGARGQGQFATPNIGGLLATNNLFVGALGVHYDVDLAGLAPFEPGLLRGTAALDVDRTTLDDVRYSPSRLRLHFADGAMHIDSARVRTDAATIELAGGLGLPKTPARDSLSFSVTVDSLGGLRPYLPHPDTTLLGAARTAPDSLSGRLTMAGYLTGTIDQLNVHGDVDGYKLYWEKDRGESAKLSFDLRNILGDYSGTLAGRIDTVTYAGIALDTIGGTLTIDDSTPRHFTAGAASHTGPVASISGDWTTLGNDTTSFRLNTAALAVADATWRLVSPADLVFAGADTKLDSLVLHNNDSAVVTLSANVPTTGAASAELRASNIPLRDVGLLAQLGDTLSGLGDFSATVSGTKTNPTVSANAVVTGARWHNVDVDRVSLNAHAADGRVNAGLNLMRNGATAVTATASLPVAVTLFSARARDDSISGVLHAEPTDLSLLSVLFDPTNKTKLSGELTADDTISGTWLAPAIRGDIAIKDGTAKVIAAGVTVSHINGTAIGHVSANGQDSVHVTLTATNDGKTPGTVSLSGYAKNLFQTKRPQSFSFEVGAKEFHAFNKRTLADLYISTSEPLRLTGDIKAPVLTGSLYVDHGSIFLPDRDIARKQAVEVIADDAEPSDYSDTLFSKLKTNLRIPNITVTLGDVRLRSAEADVKLIGELRLNTANATATRAGQLAPPRLEGTLYTAGGTYLLNLGLVRRDFQVLNNGTVTFDGDPQNPTLDIRAQYNVRRAGDRDLGVIVALNGPLLPYPGIDFSSNAGYEIPPSDLISYLIAGKPGFDYGQNKEVVLSVLAPTLSAVAADQLRKGFGSMIDVFRFQLGTASSGSTANTNAWASYLQGSTIDVEQRFKNVFVSANVGFCQFAGQNQGFNALNSVGAKAEYQFKPELSLKLSYDPSTSSRVCNLQQGIAGFAQTPWQVGLSLLRTWRF